MNLTLVNFSGFEGSHLMSFESMVKPNGEGKTTRLNAYLFALTGKTLTGFEPVNKNSRACDITSVTLHHFIGLPPIRRTIQNGKTNLYFGDDVVTQKDFEEALKNRGYDIDFIVTCARANALTSESLDTETLRKILVSADVLSNDVYDAIKKDITNVRAKIKVAEQYALTNVTVPQRTVENINDSETFFRGMFLIAKNTVDNGVNKTCNSCGRAFEDHTLDQLTKAYNDAVEAVKRDQKEFDRISAKMAAYMLEGQKINDAQRLVDSAAKARADVMTLNETLTTLQKNLQNIDVKDISKLLPENVELITEVAQKNGVSKPTCTLMYKGIPLRSVNHAKRIEILVEILDIARTNKGMQDVPIIIDNAESVEHDFGKYKNVIYLAAKRN